MDKVSAMPKPRRPTKWQRSPIYRPSTFSETSVEGERPHKEIYSILCCMPVYLPAFISTKLYCLLTKAIVHEKFLCIGALAVSWTHNK